MRLPFWIKLPLGVLILLLLYKYTPLLDLVQMFLLVVCVPLAALAAVGLISTSTAEGVANYIPSLVEKLKERIDEYRQQLEREANHG